jgi:hypothetical protein
MLCATGGDFNSGKFQYQAVIGTHTTSYGPCVKECPSLFFASREDADSYRDKLDPPLRECFTVYSAILNFESTEPSPGDTDATVQQSHSDRSKR